MNNESTVLATKNGGGGASGVEEVAEANSLILQQEPNSRTFLFQNSCVDRTDMLLLDNTLARVETVESGTQADTRKASVSTQMSPAKRPTADHHYTSSPFSHQHSNKEAGGTTTKITKDSSSSNIFKVAEEEQRHASPKQPDEPAAAGKLVHWASEEEGSENEFLVDPSVGNPSNLMSIGELYS